MQILITGATGLIGKALVHLLLTDQNVEITVLTRSPEKAVRVLGPNVTLVTRLHQQLIDQQHVVINLAGEPIADKRWTDGQKEKICQSRWHLTEKLVELINESPTPPQTFISGSAIGIYGRQQQLNIDEGFTAFHQEFSHHVCQRWEKIALGAKSNATRVVLLRTGIVLSKDGGALAKMMLPFKLGLGGKIASGYQYMSWIHIDDMINAINFLIQDDTIEGPVNMTAPSPVTNKFFSETFAAVLSRPCLFTTPAFVLKIALGELSELLLYGQHVMPKVLQSNGYTFKYPDLKLALINLLHD
ncbi:TIGR01777 family oxidoreductase [Thalassotalea marina]|uniref:Epimerase n=1 Tax=Thalassotalea marina TaxID=1673741 RepID=A0A919BPW0_9GAMM|nr:TIGR01777 family oxidoreductase [Thalassotalea marina]GHG03084.1 epimerase [Thalassotalea marina]